MGKSAEQFRKTLQQVFESERFSKAEFARRTGFSRSQIDGYLAGTVPGLDAVDKVAELLGVSAAELVSNEVPPTPRPSLKDAFAVLLEALESWDRRDFDSPLMRELDEILRPVRERLAKETHPKK